MSSRFKKLYLQCIGFYTCLYLPFLFMHTTVSLVSTFVVILLCLLRCFFLEDKLSLKQYLYHKVFSVILVLIILYDHQEVRGLEVGMSLLAVLAPLKLLEGFHKRDFVVFLMISMFLFFTQVVSIDALWMLLYVTIVCFMLFHFLFLLNRYFEFDQIDLGSSFNHEFKRTFFLFLYASPFVISLFLFFPRVSVGNMFLGQAPQTSVTGFSERLRPGEVSQIVNSNQSIFRVQFLNDFEPPFPSLYWRGGVLDIAEGLNWSMKNRGGVRFRENVFTSIDETESIQYRVAMANVEESPAFMLENSFSIDLLSPGRMYQREGETFRIRPFNNQRALYHSLSVDFQISSEAPSDQYTNLPSELLDSNPRLDQLVESFRGSSSSAEKVSRVLDFFGSQGFSYTLSPGEYEGDKGLEDFLFERQIGFCEHFAASMGVILRALDIPARVIVGFHGGDYNSIGDYYIIRARDAHAWVEYWNKEESAWLRVDPTSFVAPLRIERGAEFYFLAEQTGFELDFDDFLSQREESFFVQMFYRFDSFYFYLNELFLTYNLSAQLEFLKALGLDLTDLNFNQTLMVFFALVLLVFIVLSLPLWLLIPFVFFPESIDLKIKNAYSKIIKRMNDKFHLDLSLSLTPMQHYQELKSYITNADDFKALIQEFYDVYYATHPSVSNIKGRKKKLLKMLRRFRPTSA